MSRVRTPAEARTTIDALAEKIRQLTPEMFAELERVADGSGMHCNPKDATYLHPTTQQALADLGLIELTPGRVSAKQLNPFVIVKDAIASASYDVREALDRVRLEQIDKPCFEDKVRLGGYSNDPENNFKKDALAYLMESGLSDKMAEKCYRHAYEECHSEGCMAIVHRLDSLIDIFKTT